MMEQPRVSSINPTQRSTSFEQDSASGLSSSSTKLLSSDGAYRRSVDYKESFDEGQQVLADDFAYLSRGRVPGTFAKYGSYWKALALLLCLLLTFGVGRLSSSDVTSSRSPVYASDLQAALPSYPRNTVTLTNGTVYARPPELKIIGIVFFGRRQFVDVLDCYLRRNLAVNGGLLDEVHFLMHTDVTEDKSWLRKMVKDSDMGQYYKLKAEDTSAPDFNLWQTFSGLYRDYMTDPDAIYIKIDDDIVFIDDYAIPEIVRTMIEHPEAHSIVSNNINNKWTYYFHHRTNSIFPYLPESDLSTKWPVDTWRPSQLPQYKGDLPPRMTVFMDLVPPHEGHRWLPVADNGNKAEAISHTPWGPWLPNPEFHTGKTQAGWAVTAQAHYSLLENLERDALHKYHFGAGGDHIWNLWYTHININFMGIRGSNLLMRPIWIGSAGNDETLLTEIVPRELQMPVLIATRSITSHFAFRGDREKVLQTDVLDRYIAYANEHVCAAHNKKRRFGRKLGPHHIPHQDPSADKGHEDDTGDIGEGPSDRFRENEEDLVQD